MRNQTENQVRLVMIRHGATASNREKRYLGKTDEPLSEEGRQALLDSLKIHSCPVPDLLFASPMKRCFQTAQILYPELEPVRIAEWEEMDFGEFEGKNYRELNGDARYQAWIDSGGTLPFPGGESREAFQERCLRGLKRMLRKLREAPRLPETVGLVVHGGTIMALLDALGEDAGEKGYFDYQTENGQGYVCTLRFPAEGASGLQGLRLYDIHRLPGPESNRTDFSGREEAKNGVSYAVSYTCVFSGFSDGSADRGPAGVPSSRAADRRADRKDAGEAWRDGS